MEKKTTGCKVNTHQVGLPVRTDVIAGIDYPCTCFEGNDGFYCSKYETYGPFHSAGKDEFLYHGCNQNL